LELKPDSCHL